MDIIKRPIITEKTMSYAAKGWYTFKVSRQATKKNIASQIRVLYHVDVVDVRSVSVQGKTKRRGKKMRYIKLPTTKKVYVLLKKGQTIEVFQAVAEEAKKL